jgi:hypothetical protein
MRLLVFLAVILTIGVFLYYYHPNENPIDWFAKQQPQAINADSTAQNQPAQPQRGMPFADLAMAPDGTSPLQPQQNQLQPAQPNQPTGPLRTADASGNMQQPQRPQAQVPKSSRIIL